MSVLTLCLPPATSYSLQPFPVAPAVPRMLPARVAASPHPPLPRWGLPQAANASTPQLGHQQHRSLSHFHVVV